MADRTATIASKLFASNVEKKDPAPKIKGVWTVDKDGNIHLIIPQRITMDMLRYKVNDKGKDSFGLCYEFGQLEFVAVAEVADENGEKTEVEKVLQSAPLYLNINSLK